MLEAIFELFTKRLILLSINENVACVSEPLIRDLQINVNVVNKGAYSLLGWPDFSSPSLCLFGVLK